MAGVGGNIAIARAVVGVGVELTRHTLDALLAVHEQARHVECLIESGAKSHVSVAGTQASQRHDPLRKNVAARALKHRELDERQVGKGDLKRNIRFELVVVYILANTK